MENSFPLHFTVTEQGIHNYIITNFKKLQTKKSSENYKIIHLSIRFYFKSLIHELSTLICVCKIIFYSNENEQISLRNCITMHVMPPVDILHIKHLKGYLLKPSQGFRKVRNGRYFLIDTILWVMYWNRRPEVGAETALQPFNQR